MSKISEKHYRYRAYLNAVAGCVLFLCFALMPAINQAHGETTIEIGIDRAFFKKLRAEPQTVIIGNPSIANAIVRPNNIIILQGKAYGKTNLILLDKKGIAIETMLIEVTDNEHSTEIYKAGNRESYVCSENSCQNEIRIGDSEAHFTATAQQRKEKDTLANE